MRDQRSILGRWMAIDLPELLLDRSGNRRMARHQDRQEEASPHHLSHFGKERSKITRSEQRLNFKKFTP